MTAARFDLRERLRLPRPEVVQQASQERVRPWWATVVAVLGVYAATLFVVAPFAVRPLTQLVIVVGDFSVRSQFGISEAIALFAFAAIIALCMLYARFIERRRIRTLGFVRRRALRTYGTGMLLGGVSFALVFGGAWALGAIQSVSFNSSASFGILALLLVGYAVQSMGEETLFRGFMLVSLGARYPMGVALVASSVAFGLLHSLNSGVTVLAIANIVLIGFALGLMFLKTGDLWLCGGFHCMWNFMQGPVVGLSVSGAAPDRSALLQSVLDSQNVLVSGGAFGLEAGLLTTAVAVVLIGAFALMKPMKDTDAPMQLAEECDSANKVS